VVASLAFADGARAQSAFAKLLAAGADVVGLNCIDLAGLNSALEGVDLPETVSVFPSAGLPGNILSPTDFAKGAVSLIERGVRLIGGCCGTTPAHINALTEALA
jgi:homocysteine S-methyltransferase